MAARRIQATRFANHPGITTNSGMSSKLVQTHCQLDSESSTLLEQAMEHLNFSARAHDRILKVARTLADLEESQNIRDTPPTSSSPSNTAPSTGVCNCS